MADVWKFEKEVVMRLENCAGKKYQIPLMMVSYDRVLYVVFFLNRPQNKRVPLKLIYLTRILVLIFRAKSVLTSFGGIKKREGRR